MHTARVYLDLITPNHESANDTFEIEWNEAEQNHFMHDSSLPHSREECPSPIELAISDSNVTTLPSNAFALTVQVWN